MNAENISDPAPLLPENDSAPQQKKSGFASPMFWAQIIVFLLGVGLLIFLVYKIGLQTLTETVRPIGWGILLVIALNGARHLLRALCLYLAIPPVHRAFKFRHALAARLGGEAVSVVTFTGPVLGDATKAALLRRNVPLTRGGAAIVVDNILYYASVSIVILGGVGLMSAGFSHGATMKYVLAGIAGFAALAFTGIFLMLWFRVKPVGFLIRRLIKFDLAPNFILRKKDGIFELEANVYEFYLSRRATFFAIFGLCLLAHALSVAEVYAALRLLDFPAGVPVAFIVESLTKMVNFAFSFVPGAVGVYEGGNGVILKSLGYTTAAGVALAIVRRGAILTWTAIGLMVLLWRAVAHRTEKTVLGGA